MKSIVENWRALLSERKTDKLYDKILDFFSEHILRVEYFDYKLAEPHNLISWTYPPFHRYYYSSNQGTKLNTTWGVAYKLKKGAISTLWRIYKEIVPEDKEIFRSAALFSAALENFRILFLQIDPFGRSEVGGSMSNDGELQIMHQGRINGDFIEREEVFNFYKSRLVNILDHELVHYLNSVRSKFKDWRAKGGRNQFIPTKQEYIDSTEEIQARLIEGFRQFERMIVTSEIHEMRRHIIWLEEYSPSDFIESFIDLYYVRGRPRFQMQNHSVKNQKRIRKRIYDYMIQVREDWAEQREPRTEPETELL